MNPMPNAWHELVDVVAIEREREDRRRQLREAQQRIAALEAELADVRGNRDALEKAIHRIVVASEFIGGELAEHIGNTRRAAAAWKRAAKLYERIAQGVSNPWEVEAARRSFRDARHGRPILTNNEYQSQWWNELEAAGERKP